MGLFSKKLKIVTHDGRFHADDIFACATLELALGKIEITRTREQALLDAADYVVDVGGVYDPSKKRFDHHQPGGAGLRQNGIPYAGFGLIWKEFGEKVCGSKEIADHIEGRLVCPIDADDNGVSLIELTHDVTPYSLQRYLYTFRPTWRENTNLYNKHFPTLVAFAKKLLIREIEIARDYVEAQVAVVAAYTNAPNKQIIELDGRYPFQDTLRTFPEPLYVVHANSDKTKWRVETIRVAEHGFANRKDFPKAWAGLRDAELVKQTGVADAVFCHNGLWLVVTNSREGALKIAEIALK